MARERRDIDRRTGIVHVRRVFTDGQVKLYGKTSWSLRGVPLPVRAALALDLMPPRLDRPLLFPGVQGRHLNLHAWRAKEWTPALWAAASSIAARTRSGTRSPHGLSLSAWLCSTCPGSWARASSSYAIVERRE